MDIDSDGVEWTQPEDCCWVTYNLGMGENNQDVIYGEQTWEIDRDSQRQIDKGER